MKVYQNEDGHIVVDGEGTFIKISKDIPWNTTILTGFTFEAEETKEPEILEVDDIFVGLRETWSTSEMPIRISTLAYYGRIDGKLENHSCPGQILSTEDARKIGNKLLELADMCEGKNED